MATAANIFFYVFNSALGAVAAYWVLGKFLALLGDNRSAWIAFWVSFLCFVGVDAVVANLNFFADTRDDGSLSRGPMSIVYFLAHCIAVVFWRRRFFVKSKAAC
jgi:hypothetical protein